MTAPDSGLDGVLRQRFCAALGDGSLRPIATETTTIADGGINFVVRYVSGQRNKPKAGRGAPVKDPFLPPYEQALVVAPIAPAHIGLLNKFPVIENHLLIVTQHNEPQTALLARADFEALLTALASIDGLGFYNGGEQAGASQPHKHLQLVPLPLSDGDWSFPLSPLLSSVTGGCNHHATIPTLGFRHAIAAVTGAWWRNPAQGAARAHCQYRELLEAVDIDTVGDRHCAPYNLLMTRHWMWLVPRSRADYRGIPVNALGYAGALMVPRQEDMDVLRSLGPLTLLVRTGVAC